MFKVKPDEQERTAMRRMDENHVKGTQVLEMVKEAIVGVSASCLSKTAVCYVSAASGLHVHDCFL